MTPTDPTRPVAEMASPEFVRRVEARLLAVAAEEAGRRAAAVPMPRAYGGRLAAMTAAAMLLAALALGLQFGPGVSRPTPPERAVARRGEPALFRQTAGRVLVPGRLTAAPRPAGPQATVAAAGTVLTTRAGERRRVQLDDGSVLLVNQDTRVRYDGGRHVTLTRGEVFVEVAPRAASEAGALFTVQAPRRAVQALGTKFVVRAGDAGTGVAVTQGKVRVGRTIVAAGQQLSPDGRQPTPAPRASHLLAWTRDLVATAAGALVPASRYAGGALVAVDPQGQTANLSLRKYHIDVHIEDGFARTTIDQTYFNHSPYRLEGTFYFPLPADSSLSRLAMYVNGTLMEGGMVKRDYGRAVFEQIVKKMQDPALLEWVDGSTFKMRVFPLEGRQEKRIVLSYTQRLPALDGRLSYRFPAGHSLEAVRDWSFHARVKDGASQAWQCDSHALKATAKGRDLLLDASAHRIAVDRDVVLELGEETGAAAAARFASAEQDGARYLMLRYRPELSGSARRQRRDWVFLVETSGDRHPLLARTQVEVVRTLLANAEHDDTFAVLTAGTGVRSWTSTPRPVTPENVAAALTFLEGAHLIGALDLDRGLKAAAGMLAQGSNPHLVHIGSGLAVLGERRADQLLRQLPARACYVGVGVGKRWARSFMKRAADRSQGYFTQINPDEPVAWRAFDLLATLNTPRLLDVRVVDAAGKTTFLSDASSVCQGEELCSIARCDGALPEAVIITGLLDGQPFRRLLPVEGVRARADYLPRTWARLEIERLLAADTVKNKAQIIALSKAMYVMTPYTSLLVLENEAMYAQFKVDRGRKDHWAIYPCPATIPVVYEPLPDGRPYRIVVEPPGLERLSRLDSEEALLERIRQEIRGNKRLQAKTDIGDPVSARVQVPTYIMPFPLPGTGSGTSPPVFMSDGSVRALNLYFFSPQASPRFLATFVDGTRNTVQFSDLYISPRQLLQQSSNAFIAAFLHARNAPPSSGRPDSLSPGTKKLWDLLKPLARLAANHQYAQAERLFEQAVADPELAREPILWRMGVALATRAWREDVAVARLERALDIEYAIRGAGFDLNAVRRDYGWLLWHYEQQARIRPSGRPAADLAACVVWAADRWRALDPDGKTPCMAAARILRQLGKRELAWEYETTPLATPTAVSATRRGSASDW